MDSKEGYLSLHKDIYRAVGKLGQGVANGT